MFTYLQLFAKLAVAVRIASFPAKVRPAKALNSNDPSSRRVSTVRSAASLEATAHTASAACAFRLQLRDSMASFKMAVTAGKCARRPASVHVTDSVHTSVHSVRRLLSGLAAVCMPRKANGMIWLRMWSLMASE